MILTWAALPNESDGQCTPTPTPLEIYQTYVVKDLNFELKYPNTILLPTPQNKFFTKDNQLILSVWRKTLSEGTDLKAEYKTVLGSHRDVQITYKVFKKNYFVISGYKGSNIFYRKEINPPEADGQGFLVFDMNFPKKDKAFWDPILTVCANSLKSSFTDQSSSKIYPKNIEQYWQTVGKENFPSVGNVTDISLCVYKNTPYVAFSLDSQGFKASVMKYENKKWKYVGKQGFTGVQTGAKSLIVGCVNFSGVKVVGWFKRPWLGSPFGWSGL